MDPPIIQELLLIGGGHAHLGVLRAFGMRPQPGLRITLVARETEAAYSGMVPGMVAGLHRPEDGLVDLRRLTDQAGVRLIHAEAVGLDRAAGRLLLRDRPSLRYDLLSLDIGAAPEFGGVPGAREHSLPVWPLDGLLARLDGALAAKPDRVAVVGGGAGGVELAMAVRARLPGASIVVAAGAGLLPGLGAAAGRAAARLLAARGIGLRLGRVTKVSPGRLHIADDDALGFDLALWVTGAGPVEWLRDTGLALDGRGFLAVDPCLRVLNDPRVFAAGDCATVLDHPRPKAGVHAVRQGPPLAANLRRVLQGRAPKPFSPQRRALALLSAADGTALACWGPFALRGAWAWRWKTWLDRRWIERLRAPLAMRIPAGTATPAPAMRCAGCAAKLPADVLARALRRIGQTGGPEDAAVLPGPGPGEAAGPLLQTVDLFRAPVADPWLLGRIAATHALGDLHAVGARPVAALAIVMLPPAADAILEDDLVQLLAGASGVLAAAGAPLLGGHSAEGAELALGFCLTGVAAAAPLRKAGLRPGDALVLTKPLGTATVLAAAMQGQVRPAAVDATLAAMQQGTAAAAAVLRTHGVTACTDVTGFGLLGHLGEMLVASDAGAVLVPRLVPALPGVREALARGLRSTLHPANRAHAAPMLADPQDDAALALLCGPETAGGLLAGIPAGQAAACIDALRAAGDRAAAIIGRVAPAGTPRIILAEELPPGPAVAEQGSGSADGDHGGQDHPGAGRTFPAAAG